MPKRRKSSHPSPATFRHRRLCSPRSIRLLRLLPSTSFERHLEVELVEVSLDDYPGKEEAIAFEALSYVWGARSGTLPAVCDGKTMLITPSCQSALQYLRLKDCIRYLWVDAICVDQSEAEESVRERGFQVALMGEVYSKAKRAICWLGTGNEITEKLLPLLENIGKHSTRRMLDRYLRMDGKCKLSELLY